MPDIPRHVTQRSNRRQTVFFDDDDYRLFVELMAECCAAANVAVWAWCLMPNYVHLALNPATTDGLRAALARAHRRYTLAVNRRQNWSGYLWQGRFNSTPMDEPHTLLALRYIEQNPVRARTHLNTPPTTGIGDPLTDTAATQGLIDDWRTYLAENIPKPAADALRQHTRTGRPFGSASFTAQLEQSLARQLAPAKRGRPKRPAVRNRKG